MPISGKYTWTETEKQICLFVPLKGISLKAVDILTSSTTLKISYSPYLIDLDLASSIDEQKSRAIFDQKQLKLFLSKAEKRLWGKLLFEGNKQEKNERRLKSIADRRRRIETQTTKFKDTKISEARKTLKDQMKLEHTERIKIDSFKEVEKKEAEKQVYSYFAKLEVEQSQRSPAKILDKTVDNGKDLSYSACSLKDLPKINGQEGLTDIRSSQNVKKMSLTQSNNNNNFRKGDSKCKAENSEIVSGKPNMSSNFHLKKNTSLQQNPRLSSKIYFKNTPRLFKTPVRESTETREEAFIAKNRPHLKKNNLLNVDTSDISDSDPTWLYGKGREFYCNSDFRSAISAFSSAYEADDTLVKCLYYRAACYLKLEEYGQCVNDCNMAISLNTAINNHFPKEREAHCFRKKLQVLLASAYCEESKLDLAILSFETALTFSDKNNDHELYEDIETLKRINSALSKKKEGDKVFIGGNLEKARVLYDEALQLERYYVSALSNKAACHLGLGNIKECISDCSKSLIMLGKSVYYPLNSNLDVLAKVSISEILPKPRSVRRQGWVISTLCRRGAAKIKYEDFVGALSDFEIAVLLQKKQECQMEHQMRNDIAYIKSKVKVVDGENSQ